MDTSPGGSLVLPDDPERALAQDFRLLPEGNSFHLAQLTKIIDKHKQQLVNMAETFLSSCQRWVAIVHQATFRERCSNLWLHGSRDFLLLLLAMGMITRPLLSGNEPDSLRELMYEAVKRLFWDKDSVARPSVALIQAGLLLSVYEYGNGLLNASYVTISVCSSLAQVSGLCGALNAPPLPRLGTLASQDEMLHTWWGIIIHERMISLKSHLPIRQLHIQDPNAMNNALLEAELHTIIPKLAIDSHYPAFYLQARAAIWLDHVLEIVHSSPVISKEGRLHFQAVDRGLVHFLRILVQLGMGTCCEAIAIGLNAFFRLHHWRLDSHAPSVFTEQEREESSQAMKTILTILADVASDQVYFNNVMRQVNDDIVEVFPYTITMIYQLLLEMRDQLPPPRTSAEPSPQPFDALQNEMRMMKYILEKQSVNILTI
ncbi:hypothetical protein BO78DRAFT_416836 [Aspergillus sclerotiicarbonarius CBS 121057]|uniref:Xylanolytic transcriptional activator regulatory domain-containing protein n=1 Tax=Aspergillus sclerotiicarbonarius (strain CBS 121057 / IBT 28362) TaxID=1448318 RepID=A0A319EDT6_ASPSB|nr:hypothetical protein BO78DRAFT_416836 [Aspergillus sclerotiicarbonarius CBS 121057]